jgi:voltage-dependent calcium channel T type alpha-1G
MLYNTYSESDLESETNFQQANNNHNQNNNKNQKNSNSNLQNNQNAASCNGANKFVRNNSIKNSNQQRENQSYQLQNIQPRHSFSSISARRRASECSYYGMAGDGAMGDNVSYYSASYGSHKRASLGGSMRRHSLHRSRSTKSTASTTSGDLSHSSEGSSSCSEGDTTSTSSGQPNLPYPGFVEFSFKYLSQDARPRNWCLRLITNPYP